MSVHTTLILLAVALLACSSGQKKDEKPETKSVVIDTRKSRTDRPPKKPVAWFEEQVREIRAARREGNINSALVMIDHALRQNPQQNYVVLLRELKRDVLHDILEMKTIEGRIDSEKTPVVFGDPIRIRILLKNISGRRVEIPALRKKTSRSLFILDVVRQEFDIEAHVVLTRRIVHVPLERDLGLDAGESMEQIIEISGAGNEQPVRGFRTYTISGQLRPIRLEVDGLPRFEPVPLRSMRLRSFAQDYDKLVGKPLEHVVEALEKRKPVTLLTAAALVGPDEQQEMVDKLVEALGGQGRFDLAIVSALQYVTGVDLGRSRETWRAWWPGVRESFFEKPVERRDPDVPTFD